MSTEQGRVRKAFSSLLDGALTTCFTDALGYLLMLLFLALVVAGALVADSVQHNVITRISSGVLLIAFAIVATLLIVCRARKRSKMNEIASMNCSLLDTVFKYGEIVLPVLESLPGDPLAFRIRVEIIVKSGTLFSVPKFTLRRHWQADWQPYWREGTLLEQEHIEYLSAIHGLDGSRLLAEIQKIEATLRREWESIRQ